MSNRRRRASSGTRRFDSNRTFGTKTPRHGRATSPSPAPTLGGSFGATTKLPNLHHIFPTTRQVRLLPSFLTPTDYPEDACPARCCRPASPWRPNDRRLGPYDLNAAGDGSTISAARLSQSRSIAGVSRRRAAVGLSRPGIWRARCSSAASARSGPASTWRHYGLATRVLELEETRLGVGVRQLHLTPVPRRVLGSWSLEPTTRRLGLGARELPAGRRLLTWRGRHILFGSRKKGPVQCLPGVAAGENPSLRPQSNATTSRSWWV